MKQSLVILSDNFGLDTSGGSIATASIFEQIQDEFEMVYVVAKYFGKHNFRNIKHLGYQRKDEAIKLIIQLNELGNMIFYGDYYTSLYFISAKVPFYFTYHDNWPDQRTHGLSNFIKSFFYIPVYKKIFKHCEALINVSAYKMPFNAHLNPNTYLIRNGLNMKVSKKTATMYQQGDQLHIIMLGNIDTRKFGLASALFKQIKRESLHVKIDIFGKIIDEKISAKINAFEFVTIHGYKDDINFKPYHVLLSVSKMENLSIAVCEALANCTPVISFDVGGLNEVVKHKVNGMLIKKYDLSNLLQAIKDFKSGKLKFSFNENDLNEFDWKKAADAYLKVINSSKKILVTH